MTQQETRQDDTHPKRWRKKNWGIAAIVFSVIIALGVADVWADDQVTVDDPAAPGTAH